MRESLLPFLIFSFFWSSKNAAAFWDTYADAAPNYFWAIILARSMKDGLSASLNLSISLKTSMTGSL